MLNWFWTRTAEQARKRTSSPAVPDSLLPCPCHRVIRPSIYSFMCFTRAFATTAVLLRAVSINDQRFNKIDSPATNLKSMSVYPAMFHKFINVTNTSVSTIQTVVLTADVSYYKNVSDVPRSFQSWVSTIHTAVLTADVFHLFFIKSWKTFFIKSWKTSAVSTTVWMVETQLCKLRGTSDAFV